MKTACFNKKVKGISEQLAKHCLNFLCNYKRSRLTIIVLLLALASCRSYRSLEGRAKPVYFTADSATFTDTLHPVQTFWYSILKDLKGHVVETAELIPGATSKAIISRPTFFGNMYYKSLVYPGEHIIVKGENEGCTFLSANGNRQRNKELLFFKTFEELPKPGSLPAFVRNTTLETILNFERQQKDLLLKEETTSQKNFNSLIKAYTVSRKFKRLTRDYIKNKYDRNLWFYRQYKDTLLAHGLYFLKLRQLVPAVNGITNRSVFNANIRDFLNDLVSELFPKNLMWSFDDAGFRACFDSVENNFSGISRDYLLSRIMHRAYAKGLKVTAEYQEKYNNYSIDKSYKKIVKNTKKERELNDKDKKGIANRLLAPDGKTQLTLEKVLLQHPGKLVLIDLWASWCGPCIKEMPYMQQLIEIYPKNQVVFLTVSLDQQTSSWREAIIKQNIGAWNNYLLIDAAKTSFYKHYNISAIPRYLLFNKEGKAVNTDAPSPSKPALSALLNKLVLQ